MEKFQGQTVAAKLDRAAQQNYATESLVPLRYVRELTAQEQARLTKLHKTSPASEVVHRSHAILLSADGWRAPSIAELLRVDQSTVHRSLEVAGIAHAGKLFGAPATPRPTGACRRPRRIPLARYPLIHEVLDMKVLP